MTGRHDMTKLTTKSVENIKPADSRREIPDGGCRGLYLIVQPVTGRRSWAVRYRFRGEPKKLTLGAWPGLQLAAARKAAAVALHELAQGRDPAALKFDAKAAEAAAAAKLAGDTVENLAAQFIERHAKKKTRENSWRQAEYVINRIAVPVWRGRTVHDIKRRDVIDLIEGIAEDRPLMANRVLAHVRKFFSWLCERDIVAASPCVGVKPPAKERARDRILSDDEIVRLWAACDVVGGRVGPVVKLLLLTGQRLGEVVGMRRSEISGDVWVLPPERTKNHRRHEIALSRQALAIINDAPIIAGEEDFVFTSSRTRRLGSISDARATLDVHMKPAQPWVLHDARRTVASGMQRLGIRLPVIERCLNHVGGSFRGIVGTYQRYDFATEVRDALQRWADYVEALVSGKPAGKVVRLRETRS